MMEQIIRAFPDDKPISSICVIEDLSKRPAGYNTVSKTHDSDSDADLWNGYSWLGIGKNSRYLCISKTEGIDNYIVEDIAVIGEKDTPPVGYGLIPKTIDTDAKAWKKRQLCYKLSRRYLALSAVTDIILLSKTKKPPEGFSHAGDINGLTVCFKVVPHIGVQNNNPILPHSLTPRYSLTPKSSTTNLIPQSNGLSPNISLPPRSGDYENITARPKRPAPSPPVPSLPLAQPQINNSIPPVPPGRPPRPAVAASYATFKVHEGLEGVPFVLHPSLHLIATKGTSIGTIPVIKKKTLEELDREYFYDFRLERQST